MGTALFLTHYSSVGELKVIQQRFLALHFIYWIRTYFSDWRVLKYFRLKFLWNHSGICFGHEFHLSVRIILKTTFPHCFLHMNLIILGDLSLLTSWKLVLEHNFTRAHGARIQINRQLTTVYTSSGRQEDAQFVKN